MADSWETLVAGSSLASGDAWEHLNSLAAYDTIVVEGYILTTPDDSVTIIVDDNYILTIEDDYTLEVCDASP